MMPMMLWTTLDDLYKGCFGMAELVVAQHLQSLSLCQEDSRVLVVLAVFISFLL